MDKGQTQEMDTRKCCAWKNPLSQCRSVCRCTANKRVKPWAGYVKCIKTKAGKYGGKADKFSGTERMGMIDFLKELDRYDGAQMRKALQEMLRIRKTRRRKSRRRKSRRRNVRDHLEMRMPKAGDKRVRLKNRHSNSKMRGSI